MTALSATLAAHHLIAWYLGPLLLAVIAGGLLSRLYDRVLRSILAIGLLYIPWAYTAGAWPATGWGIVWLIGMVLAVMLVTTIAGITFFRPPRIIRAANAEPDYRQDGLPPTLTGLSGESY